MQHFFKNCYQLYHISLSRTRYEPCTVLCTFCCIKTGPFSWKRSQTADKSTGKYERAQALSSTIRRTGFAGPRSNRRLLPLSICGRKMSISRLNCPEMPFYSKLMFPWKDCSQAFHSRGCLANKKAHKKHDGKL